MTNKRNFGSSSNSDTSKEYEAIQRTLKAHVDADRKLKSDMQELGEKAARLFLQKEAEKLAQPSTASKDQERGRWNAKMVYVLEPVWLSSRKKMARL